MKDDLRATARMPERAGESCASEGCGREPRTWSRYCTLHARRVYRNRDPNFRTFKARELAPYRSLSDEFMGRLEEHPAMIAAIAYMDSLLVSPTLPAALRQEMARLRAQGATGREMLAEVLPVFLLMHFNARAAGTDVTATVNLGKRLLGTRPLPSRRTRKGKAYTTWPRGKVLETAGQLLRDEVGAFAASFAQRIETTLAAQGEAAAALREALRAHPLA